MKHFGHFQIKKADGGVSAFPGAGLKGRKLATEARSSKTSFWCERNFAIGPSRHRRLTKSLLLWMSL
jgi:hypothetical protein